MTITLAIDCEMVQGIMEMAVWVPSVCPAIAKAVWGPTGKTVA